MKNQLHLGLSGHFKFVATKRDGSQRVLADWSDNLILDSGLNRLGTGGAWERCQVGSGNTAPAVGQTGLVALVATSSNIQSEVAGTNTPTNTYAFGRRTYRFNEGEATGNLSEVGVGWSGGLFSRALIRDDEGDPTTITVLSNETLDVIYEIRAYPSMADADTVLNIAGINHTFTVRPALFSGNQTNIANTPEQLLSLMSNGMTTTAGIRLGMATFGVDAALGAVTGQPTGTALASTGATTSAFLAAYSNNSFQRTARFTAGLSAGSVPIGGLLFYTGIGCYQAVVSPALPKDATRIFTLDVALSWARRA